MQNTRFIDSRISIQMMFFFCLAVSASCSSITIVNATSTIQVLEKGSIADNFAIKHQSPLTCTMPELFIYEDQKPHFNFTINSINVTITDVIGKYHPVTSKINCLMGNCVVLLNNGCPENSKNQMNLVTVLANQNAFNFQYLVDCNPGTFYKPFEWGLFLLICFCTICITVSSMYSRAWSYGNFGINVTAKLIVIFNLLFIIGFILAYYFPNVISVSLKIIGSLAGATGVMICTSETFWLCKSRKFNKPFLSQIRPLDIFSAFVGIIMISIYWISDGAWIVNDILAVCTIISSIKIFKIRAMKTGVFMLFSLLLIEIIAGLIVHYIWKVSYNNLVIKLFESPLVIVFPSITPEFYRKCAWLPVTNFIFPGLFLSYLRRFDKARGTFLYLLIGYGSFYIGSILWMVIDMTTPHSLPMAIISDPVMVTIIFFVSNRRNEFSTMWEGQFYDPELPDMSEDLLPEFRSSQYIAFQDMTEDLKIDRNSAVISPGQI